MLILYIVFFLFDSWSFRPRLLFLALLAPSSRRSHYTISFIVFSAPPPPKPTALPFSANQSSQVPLLGYILSYSIFSSLLG